MKSYNIKADSSEEVETRIKLFIKKLKKEYPNKNILIVTHKEITRQFVREFIPKYRKLDNEKVKIRSGSISIFEFNKNNLLINYNLNKIIYSLKELDKIHNTYEWCSSKLKENNAKEKIDKLNDVERKAAIKYGDSKRICEACKKFVNKEVK